MGSLNGTLLNSKPINHPDTGSRLWGDAMNLADGDIITLGTTSKIVVSVMAESHSTGIFFIIIDAKLVLL